MMLAAIGSAIAAEFPYATASFAETFGEMHECLAENLAGLLILHLEHVGHAMRRELHELRMQHPNMKILAIAPQENRETVLWCLDAGVHGVVGPSVTHFELRQVLRTVMAGRVYVSPVLATLPEPGTRVQPNLGWEVRNARLTARQTEVLRLLAEGRSNKEIARHLGLGVGTIKVHLAHLFAALGARSRLEAIVKSGAAQRVSTGTER